MAERERVALVTGASAGIGLYTAVGLARAGFRIVMAGRDGARLERACRTVAERSGSTLVKPELADFASPEFSTLRVEWQPHRPVGRRNPPGRAAEPAWSATEMCL